MYIIGWLSDEILTHNDSGNKQGGNIRKHCSVIHEHGFIIIVSIMAHRK